MPLIRRRTRDSEPPAARRLPDLEFLALVRDSLEEWAPGSTKGTELKGNSLISPSGWAVAVVPQRHGGDQHYDLAAVPDVNIQPEVPMFLDCSVAMAGNPRHAADAWAQTAGACLLELLDRRGRFAEHAGPEDERGVPGWHMIAAGAVGVGLDVTESQRIQSALMNANVLHRIADSFAADLESPFFNGVKVFYGGLPGAMEAEVSINGERHAAASAAMAALNLPDPTVFTAVRYYALLLPLPFEVDHGHEHSHEHGATCGCGGRLDPMHPGREVPLPHLIAELSDEERSQLVRVDTGAMMVATGIGNFLKVRLPIRLEDGRTLVYLAWVYLTLEVIEQVAERARSNTLEGHRFEGFFCNAIDPWGEDLLRAPVVLEGKPATNPDAVGYCEVVATSQPLLDKVLKQTWPAESLGLEPLVDGDHVRGAS